MSMIFDQEDVMFCVVVNAEEQYSIWPEFKEIPAGWQDTGFHGLKAACLAQIEQVWTDMRPLSLRRALDVGQAGA
jgi:MbtH protein